VNFRNSAPRSAYDPYYGYMYTPAAKLLPATGAGMSWTPPSVTSRPRELLKVPLVTATNPQYSASQQFARDAPQRAAERNRAAAELAALPAGGGRFSKMQADPAPPIDENATPNPYAVAPKEFRNYGVAKAHGGEIKKSEGTADLSARAMLDTIDSDAPVKRNLPKEAQDARRARIGQAPAVPQDYSGRDLTGELLSALSLATTPLPVLPDVAGLAADYRMYQTKPEERTMGNYLLSAAGVLPFVPSVSAIKTAGKGVKTAADELAALTAKAPSPATKPVEEIFNLDPKATNADLYKSRDTLVYMSPDDFLTMAAPTKADYSFTSGAGKDKTEAILAGIKRGDLIDVPHLRIFDKDGVAQVEGHEGRHRAALMKELGYDRMPVVINSHRIRWADQLESNIDQIEGKWPTVLRSEKDPWGKINRESRDIPFPVKDQRASPDITKADGVKTAADDLLDLSQEAKAVRQVEQGYAPQDFYHATYNGFDAFDPDMVGLGTHIGTAEQANNRLKFFSKNLTGPGAEIGSNIIPLKARLGKTLEMSDVGQWNDSFDVLRSFRRDMEETNLQDYSESISDGVRDFSHPITFDKKQLQRVDDLLAESDEMKAEYRDAITTPIKFKSFLLDESDQRQVEYSDDITAWIKSPENKYLLDKTKKLIQGMGYDSIRYINKVESAPDRLAESSYIVLDPKNLRAKTADYDPSKLDSSDLGHAKGGSVQKYATGSEVSSPKQTIEAIEPSLRDTIQQFIYDKMGGANSPEARARALRYQNIANNVMDWTPGLSTEVARSDAEADYNQGSYGKAALGMVLAGLDVVPGAGKVTKVAAKELSNLTGAAAEAMSPIVLRGSKKESPAATALTQIEEQFKRNPFDDREVVGDGAAATLYTTGDDSLHLSDIRTLDPGKGNSSRLLSQILAITDKNKVDVDLIAEAYNKGLSTEQLRDWYARNGFEALEQDPDTMLRMYDRAAGKGPLDKTLEARMARAAEQGYTGPLYHGTADIENEGFDEFNKKFYGSVTNSPSAKMGTWLTDDPQTANIYASFAPFSTLQGLQDKYQSTAEKLWRKSGMLEGEARTAAREKDKLKLAPLADKIKQATEALEAGVPDPAEARKFFPLPTRIGGGGGANIMPVRARGNFMEYDAANTSIRELRDKKGLTKLAKEAREGGYDGLKITNFSDPLSAPHATHYLVFDTKNIRSEYADYDPSKLESSNLGHADGGLIKKYATGSEVSSNTADLLAQMKAVGDRPNTPTPNAPPLAKEQTDSRSMLDNLIRAYEQNISKPMVGSLIDMTLGLGDLGQMGTKYLANRAGIKTDPFVSTAEPAKAAAGVTGYDPYTIGGIATNLLPFARGKQAIGGAAKTFASMFPNLGREALSYAGGEAGAAAAREVLPDSTLAQVVASGAGSIAAGRGGSPTMSNMAVKNEGNLNLTPIARAEVLKGPEVQTVENFLNQLRGKPGMTQNGLDDLAKQYVDIEPNTRMTKAKFEQLIPPSQYNKVDLAGSADNASTHLWEMAQDEVADNPSFVYRNVLDRLGVADSDENMGLLDDYYYRSLEIDDLTPELQEALRLSGMDTSYTTGREALQDLINQEHDVVVNDAYQVLQMNPPNDVLQEGGYAYRDYQRLLQNPDKSADGYFELGVTHPEQNLLPYKHYPAHQGKENLIGHVRGTLIPASAGVDARAVKGINGEEYVGNLAKPNSMVIEEIQSDAQKGEAQSGVLRQVHGTLFKAAIQHALEKGVDTVYLPTAEAIGDVRGKPASAYASIYDQQIVKEGLNPLLKIPGVESKMLGDYHEITFTPEAIDVILKGEGQAAPGYAKGGLIKKAKGGNVERVYNDRKYI